jgi:hypothetical protein
MPVRIITSTASSSSRSDITSQSRLSNDRLRALRRSGRFRVTIARPVPTSTKTSSLPPGVSSIDVCLPRFAVAEGQAKRTFARVLNGRLAGRLDLATVNSPCDSARDGEHVSEMTDLKAVGG